MKLVHLTLFLVTSTTFAMFPSNTAHACAMPSELIIQQQLLNLKHANATHVMGATWKMQQAGKLDMPDPKRIVARGKERIALDEAERLAALRALTLLQDELARKDIRQEHAISIVLVERMHRQPLLTAGRRSLDAFSAKNDMLWVTTEPALHAMTQGRLTLSEAHSEGVVRIYGNEREKTLFITAYAEIGSVRIDKAVKHLPATAQENIKSSRKTASAGRFN